MMIQQIQDIVFAQRSVQNECIFYDIYVNIVNLDWSMTLGMDTKIKCRTLCDISSTGNIGLNFIIKQGHVCDFEINKDFSRVMISGKLDDGKKFKVNLSQKEFSEKFEICLDEEMS